MIQNGVVVEFSHQKSIHEEIEKNLHLMFEETDFQCLVAWYLKEKLEEYDTVSVVREIMHKKIHTKPDVTIVSTYDSPHIEALFEIKYDFGRSQDVTEKAMLYDIEKKLDKVEGSFLKIFLCATDKPDQRDLIYENVKSQCEKLGVHSKILHFSDEKHRELARVLKNRRIEIEGL